MPKGKEQGTCGGTPKRDGSGKGIGNKGTKKQPPKSKQFNYFKLMSNKLPCF